MDGFIILLFGGLLTAGIIGFIRAIAKGMDQKEDAPKEHYNYRLHTFSRIVYFIALMASTIVPLHWLLGFGISPIFITLFYASPFSVFLMQNIMAHKLREHNISLHFIALCAAILSVAIIFYQNLSCQVVGTLFSVPIIFYNVFVGFYAFFAWMTALSNRNK